MSIRTEHQPAHSVFRKSKTIPSLIKWTGSKRSQARAIAGFVPPHKRYIEPFLGGGALLYLCGTQGSIAGDIYKPLIGLWKLVQLDPERVISDYSAKWSALQCELDPVYQGDALRGSGVPGIYYTVRARFNAGQDPLDLNFLMRTCVNGIARFNHEGEFNNSFHLSRRGMEPRRFEKAVFEWHRIIKDVGFFCQDYRATLEMAGPGDFIYFDPPYAGNKQRYTKNLDVEEFFLSLDALNKKGVKWALSFDGKRGSRGFGCPVPKSIYKKQFMLNSGNSAVNKVLNGPIEEVRESLYLNY